MATSSAARIEARKAYALAIERTGPAWANTAASVRAGYSNVWIEAAIDALEPLVILSGDEDPPEDQRP